jgi:hypothetical protein
MRHGRELDGREDEIGAARPRRSNEIGARTTRSASGSRRILSGWRLARAPACRGVHLS